VNELVMAQAPPQPAAEPQHETPSSKALTNDKLPRGSDNFGERELRLARISLQSENELPSRLLDLSSFLANASEALPVCEVHPIFFFFASSSLYSMLLLQYFKIF
jgi:hypothetical protein